MLLFEQYKTPALVSQYLILAFSMEGNPSYFLFWCFEQYKTPAVPHFSTLSRLKPQSYLYLELYIDYPHTPPPCPPPPSNRRTLF